ncbi:MAG: hypothetical protein CMF75_09685 [Maricaulis sp.]|nr:hypothetical protein [Maricaulis sp.]
MPKLGLIASLSGPKEKIGTGMARSLELGIDLAREQSGGSDAPVEVLEFDDHGNAHDALMAYRACREAGCDAIVGPADSDSMRAILAEAGEPAPVLFSTIATATQLTERPVSGFFRLTTPDAARVAMLVQTILQIYGRKPIRVFAARGNPHCYAQSLKQDVTSHLDTLGLDYSVQDFSTGRLEIDLPAKGEPVLVCAVSADSVKLAEALRKSKCRNQVFGFGSNTNWFHRSTIGSIVVADLDRDGTDERLQASLKQLEDSHLVSDPSLPTVNAGYIVQTLARQLDEASAQSLRTRLHEAPVSGIFGPLSFTQKGEMAGFEQISPLRVKRRLGRYWFSALRRREKPTFHDIDWVRSATLNATNLILAILGVLVGILGVWLSR